MKPRAVVCRCEHPRRARRETPGSVWEDGNGAARGRHHKWYYEFERAEPGKPAHGRRKRRFRFRPRDRAGSRLAHGNFEAIEPLTAGGADRDGLGVVGLEYVEIRTVGNPVRLVQNQKRWVVFEAELGEDGLDRLDLAFSLGTGGINNVQQQLSLTCFLEGRLERRDQGVGQVADEADSVGKQSVASAAKTPAPGACVERGKQLVFDQDTRRP